MKIYSTPATYAAAHNYLVVGTNPQTGKDSIFSQHKTRAAANDELPIGNYASSLRVMTRAQFAKIA